MRGWSESSCCWRFFAVHQNGVASPCQHFRSVSHNYLSWPNHHPNVREWLVVIATCYLINKKRCAIENHSTKTIMRVMTSNDTIIILAGLHHWLVRAFPPSPQVNWSTVTPCCGFSIPSCATDFAHFVTYISTKFKSFIWWRQLESNRCLQTWPGTWNYFDISLRVHWTENLIIHFSQNVLSRAKK